MKNLNEVPNYPGFCYFPENQNIAVSQYGQIMDLKINRILAISNSESPVIKLPAPGDSTETLIYPIDYLVARTFIDRPIEYSGMDYSRLKIIHIDGNVNNNQITNLKWEIKTKYKLDNKNLANAKPNSGLAMEVKDTDDDKIYTFKSILSVEKFLRANLTSGIPDASTIRYYLDINRHPEGIGVDRFLIRKKFSDYNWNDITFILIKKDINREYRKVKVHIKNLYTQNEYTFEAINDAANFIGMKSSTLQRVVRDGNYRYNRYGYWVIRKDSDNDWPDVDILTPSQYLTYDSISVVYKDTNSNINLVYSDVYDLCEKQNLNVQEVLDYIRNNEVKENGEALVIPLHFFAKKQ